MWLPQSYWLVIYHCSNCFYGNTGYLQSNRVTCEYHMMSHDWCTSSVNIQVSSYTELLVLKVSWSVYHYTVIISCYHSYHQNLILLLSIEYVIMLVVIWWIVRQLPCQPIIAYIVIMYLWRCVYCN